MSSTEFELRKQRLEDPPEVISKSPRYAELRNLKKELEKNKSPEVRYWITPKPPEK